jgi:hypothetical protein
MSNFDTYSPATGGIPGTAPQLIVATTDDTLAAITTAGYMEDLYSAGMTKARDVWYVNYDVDGTPGSGIFLVTATSGGSLVAYPNAVGGALLAANDLSDVASASTSRTNLGLGTGDSPTFTGLTLSGYYLRSRANAITAFAGGGQASATQLAAEINRVTVVATAGDSVKLPAAVAGRQVTVINADAADAMDCFPQTGEIINALAANTALSIAANKTVIFSCAVAGTWNSVVTA